MEIKTLILGSVTSFFINVVALYFYSRLYSKEQFGVFALFVSFITIGSILATFRIDNLIVLQKTKKEAAFFSVICNKLVLFFSLVILCIAILFYFYSILFFKENKIIWLIIPISIYFFSIVNVFIAWNNKIKKYRVISNYRFIQALTAAFFSVLFGYLEIGIGLIIGQTIGFFISASYLMLLFYKEVIKINFEKVTYIKIKEILINNKDIINYSYGLGFVLKLTQALPNFILNTFFGSGIVGVYDMTIKILNIPRTIISTNIGEIYYQKASIFYHRKNLKFNKITTDTTVLLFFVAILLYLPFVLFGKDLFSFFLGENWIDSGVLSETMAFWYILIFITMPMAYVFYIKRILNKLFWYCCFSFLIKISIFLYFANFEAEMATVYNYIYVCLFLEFLLLIYIIKNGKINLKSSS